MMDPLPMTTAAERRMVGLILLVLALGALAGCMGGGLVPQQRQQAQTVAAVEKAQSEQTLAVTRLTKGTPAPAPVVAPPVVTPPATVTVSGASNQVAVTYGGQLEGTYPAPVRIPLPEVTPPVPFEETVTVNSEAAAKVSEDRKDTLASKVSLPLGVSLLIFAAGVLAVLYAIRTARVSSGAVDAAFGAADEVLKRGIDRARERAMNSVDAAEIAREQTRIATYEAERGKLWAKR